MKRLTRYLKYTIQHKFYVFLACLEVNMFLPKKHKITIRQMLFHDMSKFRLSELRSYVKTFYTIDGERQYDETPEFAMSWKQHQNRNNHHWQHYLLRWDRNETTPLKMPERYVGEMVADWIGTGLIITGRLEVKKWYNEHKEDINIHPETRALVEYLIDKTGE